MFSVLIPTYNNIKTIESSLNSVLLQNYNQIFEVIIQNNNSTDGTTELINEIIAKNDIRNISVKHIINDSTVTMYQNHNLAIDNSSGDYLLFCHSDDFLMYDCLSILHHKIASLGYSRRVIIAGNSIFRSYSQTFMNGKGYPLYGIHSGEIAISAIVSSGGLTPSGTCYARGCFQITGGFIIGEHLISPSDFITQLAMMLNGCELVMLQRLLFIRKIASTANNVSRLDHDLIIFEVFTVLSKYLSSSDFLILKSLLFNNRLGNIPNLDFIRVLKQNKMLSGLEQLNYNVKKLKYLFILKNNRFSLFARIKVVLANVVKKRV